MFIINHTKLLYFGVCLEPWVNLVKGITGGLEGIKSKMN
jgi:hypothetical protein